MRDLTKLSVSELLVLARKSTRAEADIIKARLEIVTGQSDLIVLCADDLNEHDGTELVFGTAATADVRTMSIDVPGSQAEESTPDSPTPDKQETDGKSAQKWGGSGTKWGGTNTTYGS